MKNTGYVCSGDQYRRRQIIEAVIGWAVFALLVAVVVALAYLVSTMPLAAAFPSEAVQLPAAPVTAGEFSEVRG